MTGRTKQVAAGSPLLWSKLPPSLLASTVFAGSTNRTLPTNYATGLTTPKPPVPCKLVWWGWEDHLTVQPKGQRSWRPADDSIRRNAGCPKTPVDSHIHAYAYFSYVASQVSCPTRRTGKYIILS